MSNALAAVEGGHGGIRHLMIPGPCRLHPRELAVLGRQIEPHYGPAWMADFAAVHEDLALLLGADRTYLLPGSGSAGLDAAMFNLFEPGQRVAVVNSGYFGSRLVDIARAHGLDVRVVECVPGEPVDPARIDLGGCDGLVVTHVETATAVRHPIEELAKLAHASGAVLLVDAIAAAGGEHIDMRAMGVDALVSASQKGLGAAPGLAVVALSDAGKQRVDARSVRPPTWYLDLARWEHAATEDDWEPTPVTMPTSLIQVLASSLRRIHTVGRENWVAQRAQLRTECRDGLRRLGFDVVAADEHAANLVVVARHPRANELCDRLLDAGVMIAGGLEPFAGETFRVGLVGTSANRKLIETLLHEIERIL
ncbi:alanine-glyoxylate transaminase / serine-glyoxylate transaminase / serine-pyruvate transaminase [Amycolatopsis xylanica]|uniref:Alanine-glyoxylate transaminase / serine-glyoxylate transaminase / serine-pyruvate transaminase n=1 Tax=Amycolatopsis xylanica TaxID=589385 RepID=A0A1H3DW86_9PSEU|nr:aminotransferase class V-fold PLP-dependent enzyme [Amycolatopsis xylanica]SDX69954.1 alanine-glyoxylate transaminase / serine-glyoxylate transaminase / serine-pyruvate transaminase [Amycolatopsis xylanica]